MQLGNRKQSKELRRFSQYTDRRARDFIISFPTIISINNEKTSISTYCQGNELGEKKKHIFTENNYC